MANEIKEMTNEIWKTTDETSFVTDDVWKMTDEIWKMANEPSSTPEATGKTPGQGTGPTSPTGFPKVSVGHVPSRGAKTPVEVPAPATPGAARGGSSTKSAKDGKEERGSWRCP